MDVQKKSAHALEQDRPDILKRRRAWFDSQHDLDPTKLAFIDETGLSTKMARVRGRAPCGERCRAGVPHGHWKTTTFTGSLSPSTSGRREMPWRCRHRCKDERVRCGIVGCRA